MIFRGWGGGAALDEEVDISDALGREGRAGMGGIDGGLVALGFDFPPPPPPPPRWRGRKGPDFPGRGGVEGLSSLCPIQAFGSGSTAVTVVEKEGVLSRRWC